MGDEPKVDDGVCCLLCYTKGRRARAFGIPDTFNITRICKPCVRAAVASWAMTGRVPALAEGEE